MGIPADPPRARGLGITVWQILKSAWAQPGSAPGWLKPGRVAPVPGTGDPGAGLLHCQPAQRREGVRPARPGRQLHRDTRLGVSGCGHQIRRKQVLGGLICEHHIAALRPSVATGKAVGCQNSATSLTHVPSGAGLVPWMGMGTVGGLEPCAAAWRGRAAGLGFPGWL